MAAAAPLLEKCLELLTSAAPRFPVIEERKHTAARAQLLGAKTIEFAYLYPAPGPRITLDLYPGDTLEQARELYGDRSRVEHLLALRERGWRLEPNFHFGFMTKGLTWTRSSLGADEYTDYWVKRIDGLGAFPPEDWEQELGRLIADGIFHPADRPQFDADFTNTNRKHATPRPGLRLTQAWPHTHALSEGFAEELREALRQALHALGEYQATADLRPSRP